MTPAELKTRRVALGYTQPEFAGVLKDVAIYRGMGWLRVSEAAVKAWERGSRRVPAWVPGMLEFVPKNPDPVSNQFRAKNSLI